MKTKRISPVQLYIIDEFSQIATEISNRFDSPEKYLLYSYSSFHQFLEDIKPSEFPGLKKPGLRIILYVINKHLQNNNTVSEALKILEKIRDLPDKYSVIFVVDSKYKEEGQQLLEAGASAWIVNNQNAIHWIDNQIKGSISRNNLEVQQRASRNAYRILIAYVILVFIFAVVARLLFPIHF